MYLETWQREIQRGLDFIYTQQYLKSAIESEIKFYTNLWNWLFICRRQLYRDRIYCGLKRDENLNVIRDENGHIEFLEKPRVFKRLVGLNDDHLYQKLLLDRMHPMYQEFITMLGNGDEIKGKDVLRKKLAKEEYALSTEAVEYARAKIFRELQADAEFMRKNIAEEGGDIDEKQLEGLLTLKRTNGYFTLGMKKWLNADYEDRLADARLGKQRIDEWSEDEWSRDRAKIQIDFYCREWIGENGADRFVLFDNVTEDIIKPDDFKALLTRYVPFIPKCGDLYAKYELAMWGTTSGNIGGNS